MGLTKLDTSLNLPLISAYVFGLGSSGSSEEKISKRNVVVPYLQSYITLLTDLHIHSVFRVFSKPILKYQNHD